MERKNGGKKEGNVDGITRKKENGHYIKDE